MRENLDPPARARTHGTSAPGTRSAGFSLVELLAAMLLTVLTIMGLAHTLGLGNGFIDRYGAARAALARANGQLERVRAEVRDGALIAPVDSLNDLVLVPGISGQMRTHVAGVDDPVDDPETNALPDYFRVSAAVSWRQGGVTDSVVVSTLVFRP